MKKLNKKTKLIGLGAGLLVAILFLVGCVNLTSVPANLSGGGTIGADEKANFGFSANTCSPSGKVHGQFTYIDQASDVKFNGEVTDAVLCLQGTCNLCGAGEYQIALTYKSINPKLYGRGEAVVCLREDNISLRVMNGPFSNYSRGGVFKGKVQSHECK